MKVSKGMLKIGGGAGAGALVLVLAYVQLYGSPRAEVIAGLATSREKVATLQRQLEERGSVTRRLKEFGSQTLGKKEDQVVDRFRNGLSKIAEECGLVAVQTNSGAPKPVTNPVTTAKVDSALKKALRKTPDFEVISGSVEGTGSLEQVLRALAVVQAQPWVHRMDGFSIQAANRERDRFKIRLEVATVLAPDLAPAKDIELAQAPPPMGAEAVWRSIAARNPFKEPAPPAPVGPAPTVVTQNSQPAPALPPPPPPYADWKLTSVVSGRNGTEAWLVNVRTKEHQVLTAGARLIDAVFTEGAGERAVFEIAGQRFEILNGQTFASRRLLN